MESTELIKTLDYKIKHIQYGGLVSGSNAQLIDIIIFALNSCKEEPRIVDEVLIPYLENIRDQWLKDETDYSLRLMNEMTENN